MLPLALPGLTRLAVAGRGLNELLGLAERSRPGSTTAVLAPDSRPRRMADRFYVVSVWIDDKSGVVVGVIVRAQARSAVVFATGFQRCAMEGVDFLARSCDEGDVQRSRLVLRLEQAQGRVVSPAEFDTVRRLAFYPCLHSQRRKCLEIEGFACSVVADSELDVVKHAR